MNLYWPRHRLFRSERRQQRRRRARWLAAEQKAATALVLSHGNCLDGVTSAVITQRVLGPGQVGVAYLRPGDLADALELLATRPGKGRKLLVADLSLQRDQFDAIVAACAALRTGGWTLEWRDHHHKQWEGLPLERLREHLDVLTVNADATESGASLQQQALAPDDPFLKALAETVRDRDLWWNRTPDSETLEFALTDLGTKAFAEHYLKRAPGPVVDADIAAAAQRERDGQQAVKQRLLDQARYFGDGATKVGVVYGWLPKNTGLHELLEDHGCQVAVNVRPNGKVSLRSRKPAAVCHRIAQKFDGGGHPNASGADLGLKGGRFWWYVLRRGRVAIVDSLAEVAVQELRAGPDPAPNPAPAGGKERKERKS